MGILSFLTASRLKAELTRQRDEIARLHQMLDVETTQKQDAEKLAAENAKKIEAVTAECERQKEQQALHEKACQDEKRALVKKWDSERQELKTAGIKQVEEMESRLADLRRELDEKQRQRGETPEQNAVRAERAGRKKQGPGDRSQQDHGESEPLVIGLFLGPSAPLSGETRMACFLSLHPSLF